LNNKVLASFWWVWTENKSVFSLLLLHWFETDFDPSSSLLTLASCDRLRLELQEVEVYDSMMMISARNLWERTQIKPNLIRVLLIETMILDFLKISFDFMCLMMNSDGGLSLLGWFMILLWWFLDSVTVVVFCYGGERKREMWLRDWWCVIWLLISSDTCDELAWIYRSTCDFWSNEYTTPVLGLEKLGLAGFFALRTFLQILKMHGPFL
jgi:hypothetical protein